MIIWEVVSVHLRALRDSVVIFHRGDTECTKKHGETEDELRA